MLALAQDRVSTALDFFLGKNINLHAPADGWDYLLDLYPHPALSKNATNFGLQILPSLRRGACDHRVFVFPSAAT
jgi:hypothetical protein